MRAALHRGEHPGMLLRAAEIAAAPFVALHARLYDSGFLPAVSPAVPAVSVGNLAVGGTGKTPCTIWLARALLRRGERPAILTRGYGRQGKGVLVLEPGRPAPPVAETGDEPLEMFLALDLPVIIGRDRRETAGVAAERGATCLVLDDAFQHRPLRRNFDLVLLDAAEPFGNGHRLPAGPLRESPSALARADAILLTRGDCAADLAGSLSLVREAAPGVWTGVADHVPTGLVPFETAQGPPAASPTAGTAVIVTAGIARPDSAARSVASLGLRVEEVIAFRDHQSYSAADLALVLRKAGDRPIVSTAKDAVRWRSAPGFRPEGRWWIVGMEFRPREEREIVELIAGAMFPGPTGESPASLP
jgi:tetraacyldisaccharide 4'-kinase